MKSLSILYIILMMTFLNTAAHAQSDSNRFKIQLTTVHAGKKLITDLNNVNMSLTRTGYDLPTAQTSSDTSKNNTVKSPYGYGFYLSMDARTVSDDLLKLFSKKATRFDGSITIKDSYGKNPDRIIAFKNASLYSYSDQYASNPYSDAYGSAMLSILCEELSVNGVLLEQ